MYNYILLFIFHFATQIYFLIKTNNNKYFQYNNSIIHSFITVLLYISHLYIKPYNEPLDYIDKTATTLHLSYFTFDIFYEITKNRIHFIIHHLFSIYFISLNIYTNSGGIIQICMFIAEFSALFINSRALYIKIFKKNNFYIDIITIFVYVFFRCVITPIWLFYCLFFDEIVNYQIFVCFIIFFFMSLKWSFQLIKKIILLELDTFLHQIVNSY